MAVLLTLKRLLADVQCPLVADSTRWHVPTERSLQLSSHCDAEVVVIRSCHHLHTTHTIIIYVLYCNHSKIMKKTKLKDFNEQGQVTNMVKSVK